jgi:DNA integrity scanning protein DisA with diadenylate cyclase activity
LISIFFKSNPLHDGAVIIKDGRIAASSCILPISKQQDIAQRFGLRHRAGLGISELTDAIAIIISEETGSIEIAKDGILYHDLNLNELRTFFAFDFSDTQEELPHLILAKRLFTRK